MSREQHVELGIIQREKGLKGEVILRWNQPCSHLSLLQTLWIQRGYTMVPYRVKKIVPNYPKSILNLNGVNDFKAAHELRGCSVFVSPEELSQSNNIGVPLKNLIGYQVEDVKAGSLGSVQAIYRVSFQPLLAIDYQSKELLIPYHEDIVTHIEPTQQHITVQLPTGFVEASLN